jgi:hypothetical protein
MKWVPFLNHIQGRFPSRERREEEIIARIRCFEKENDERRIFSGKMMFSGREFQQ